MNSNAANPNATVREALETVLGYLNFSFGSGDSTFLRALNDLFAEAENFPPHCPNLARGSWQGVHEKLARGLDALSGEGSAFGDCEQAEAVVGLVFESVLPAYRQFHGDLLFHLRDEELFRPLLVGRVCDAVLAQGPPWREAERITTGAIAALNDYVGYRPVPTLQTHKHEPYAHESIRPIPLYIEGAAVGVGRYHDVVEIALQIVRNTGEDILRAAQLNPDWLAELAMDPRAYDFEHPANKRPNYHFGQWDPHCIDNQGRYRRLVVQQVTLNALMERVEDPRDLPPNETLYEGGAVLAGVMLMATGISGWGPEAIDSTVNLATLLPHIAGYRDAFYEHLLAQVRGPHGKRLREEARRMRQPFAGARQDLNAALTRQRAAQIGHVQMAKLFSRMGYVEAAERHADVVPCAGARILCRVDCELNRAQRAIESQQLEDALGAIAQTEQLVRRGIECGAIVDPWSILGFDAHFSLFPALENSIRDFRADDLAALVDEMFQRYTALWCAATAPDCEGLQTRVADAMRRLADWWHPFAAHEVSSIDAPNGELAYDAARHVAEILKQWHEAGASAGDVRFWAPHAHLFESPKAYATVIEALLEGGDFVASKALLVHWLSRAEETGLEQGECSFSKLALRWLRQLQHDTRQSDAHGRWALTKHLFDLFEVNAEHYGQAPEFLLGGNGAASGHAEEPPEMEEDDDDDNNIYGAAYEEVVYRDSTDDGQDADLFDYGQPSEDELEAEAKRISLQLGYLTTLSQLWKLAAWRAEPDHAPQRRDSLLAWFAQADEILSGLSGLLARVAGHHIPSAGVDCDSLVEFDRQHSIQEALLDRIAQAHVEVADAALFMLAAASAAEETIGADWQWPVALSDEGRLAVSLTAALMRGEAREAQARCAEYLEAVEGLPLLYIPISRGGDPHEFVLVRRRQKTLQNLAFMLPRLGLLRQAREIVEAARAMEHEHPVGPGAVTEFDDLFEVAYSAIIDSILHSSRSWWENERDIDETAVFALLEHITRPMNKIWDAHSRTLRLSVLERAVDEKTWGQIVRFIRRYGGDLFTQHFLNLGNLRAIGHQGVEQWLDEMAEHHVSDPPLKLLDELGGRLSRRRAVRCLTLILDAIAENYFEYRDYNATRTESDHGEELYKLLDFLRLRVEYDTLAWRYRPVMIAHELLLKRGRAQAAELFRRGLERCSRDEADRFEQRLLQLQDEHAMQMPTVAEKLAERFVQPTAIHRLRWLIKPAMGRRQSSDPVSCFHLLEQEAEAMLEQCGGVGLDVPPWLLALEEEVECARRPPHERDERQILVEMLPQLSLSEEQLESLLEDWSE